MAFTVPAAAHNTVASLGTAGITITKPAGLQDDDILYAFTARGDDVGGAWSCSGWTSLADQQTTVERDFNSAVLRKVITDASSEAANYTFVNSATNSRATTGIIVIVRGGDTDTPEDANTVKASGTDNDAPDSPTITTATDGALVLVFCATENNEGANTISYAAPSGYTLADSTSSDFRAQAGAAYAAKASAGATGAISWTNTPDDSQAESHTYTVAVKPGSGGAPSSALPMAMRHYQNLRT